MTHAGRVAVPVLVVVVTAVCVSLIAPAGGAARSSSDGLLQENGADVSPDRVVVAVEVLPDGTARWQVDYRVTLDGANRTAAFKAARQNVTAHPIRYAGRFRERQQSALTAAENATGREMELRNVSVGALRRQPAGLPDEYGVLRYTFEWAGFGTTEGGRVRAGDALTGFFLRSDWVLHISWPADYHAVETAPPPDEERERTAVWRGPTEFTTGGPRVVLEPAGGTGFRLPDAPPLLAAGVLAAVLLAVGYRQRENLPLPGGPEPVDAEAGGTTTASAGDTAEPADEGDAEAGVAATPPEELLSDEERVVRLLEEQGGRMKQQDVVAALDWSETKTSQVVNELHEAEKIERYRLGRENVLALPGEMDV